MLLLSVHIFAGLLALSAGAVAMCAKKGGKLHRQGGLVFVIAMLVMSSLGALMAAMKPDRGSVVGGVLAFYLVCTAFLTVRRPVEQARGATIALMLVAAIAGISGIRFGFQALASANGRVDGIPAPPLFFLGSVAVIGAVLDARLLIARRIDGAHRLARHLWRMTFAMWIATMSFFLGQAKIFPIAIRKSGLLPVPVIAVLLFLIFWLVRTLWKRRAAAVLQTP